MSITVFGVLWIIVNLAVFFKRIEYGICVLLLSCIFQASSVFFIGDNAIAPYLFTGCLFIIKCLSTGVSKRKFSCEEKALVIFLLTLIFVTITALVVFGGMSVATTDYFDWARFIAVPVYTKLRLTKLHITYFIILLVLCLDFLFLERLRYNINYDYIRKFINKLIIFVLVIGLIQYITTNLDLPSGMLEKLVYSKNDSGNSVGIYREQQRLRLFSTFAEPSYCGAFLSAAFWYNFILSSRKFGGGLSLLILAEIVLTDSSTAYAGFVAGLLLYFVLCLNNIKAVVKIIVFCLLFFLVLKATGYFDIIIDRIVTKKDTMSGVERSALNREALRVFFKTYGFGTGYASIRASSMLMNLLAQIGILGTLTFINFVYKTCKSGIKKASNNIKKADTMFLLVVCACATVACPDLTFSALWLALYMNVLSNKFLKNTE